MKFMKIGNQPDTFYNEDATRTVISDVPCDLIIKINNITYLLHKFPLLPKCGLLQQLCSGYGESSTVTIELHDIPGGENSFELCAKFCYGITINLSANNFVSALCAAKFLQMNESVEKGNFIVKLESFFSSCILEGWKDSILTLQSTTSLPEWSVNQGMIKKCIDSIVEKILTPPAKVTWSYTYTRPGYEKKRHQSVKDWWTEDISDLEIDLFRCVITAIRSTYMLAPQLIGEALHVYACRWLPDITKTRLSEGSQSHSEEHVQKSKRLLETIVGMIPSDRGSVSVGFLLRLLGTANYLRVSPVTKTELIRRSCLQLEEATVTDLLIPSQSSSDQHIYDIDLVGSVLESLLGLWRRQVSIQDHQFLTSMRKVGKLIDSYLQVVARDVNMPVSKVVSLAGALPEIARQKHDDLYKAINFYLKEHPDLSKADKKRLCRILDCQKLSSEVCAHAVKNERLPLRTVVQVLFFEQERGSRIDNHNVLNQRSREKTPVTKDDEDKLKLGLNSNEDMRSRLAPEKGERDFHKMKMRDGKVQMASERTALRREIEELEVEKGMEVREEEMSRSSKMDTTKIIQKRSNSSHGRDKGR